MAAAAVSLSAFEPLCNADARVLVLGSMPGAASLQAQQYYAHPRNAFWPIMAGMLGFDSQASYTDRMAHLSRHGIALWDVLDRCRRRGSLDSAIRTDSIEYHDFAALYARSPGIHSVFFNGAKSEELYFRGVKRGRIPSRSDLRYRRLPSTSPAMAALSLARKQEAWHAVAEALRA